MNVSSKNYHHISACPVLPVGHIFNIKIGSFIMTVNEFMTFVSLVCNLEAPTSQVPRVVKENCMEYYVNCVIKDDKEINRIALSNCNLKAKEVSETWGNK